MSVGWLHITYHLLREPETAIQLLMVQTSGYVTTGKRYYETLWTLGFYWPNIDWWSPDFWTMNLTTNPRISQEDQQKHVAFEWKSFFSFTDSAWSSTSCGIWTPALPAVCVLLCVGGWQWDDVMANEKLGGGGLKLGELIQIDSYFSNRLKPPSRKHTNQEN